MRGPLPAVSETRFVICRLQRIHLTAYSGHCVTPCAGVDTTDIVAAYSGSIIQRTILHGVTSCPAAASRCTLTVTINKPCNCPESTVMEYIHRGSSSNCMSLTELGDIAPVTTCDITLS